jgi:hypothetical protein
MRKIALFAYCLCMFSLLTGCIDNKISVTLQQIDTLMTEHPDSALKQLDSLRLEKAEWPKSLRMRYDLLEAKAQNKAFIPFTTDSIAKDFTIYYDNNGSANERMLAHYLLGCAYRDLGEAPHAIDCYLTAISKADTTAKDCDFYTLSCVYAQMADIYYQQLLLSNNIESLKKASGYALRAHNPFFAILNYHKTCNAYILLNKTDSAKIVINEAIRQYRLKGFSQKALQAFSTLIYIYVNNHENLSEAKTLMDEYEAECSFFDKNHELPPSKRQYYYYKGQYFEGVHQLDSAEYYYRKVYYPLMPPVAQNPMYKGLLNVFTKRHQTDSIAKYAKLYCDANDSSIAKKDQDLTAHMAANYNYNRYQRQALDNERRAHHTQLLLIGILIITSVTASIIYIKWNNNKKKQEELRQKKQQELDDLKTEYANATDNYNKNLHTLQLLDKVHQEVIAAIQEELNTTKSETESYKSKIYEINRQYEDNKQELTQENEFLKTKIEELKRQEGIRKQITVSQQFTKTEIVKRLFYLVDHPLVDMTEKEWQELIEAASNYYPALLHDLTNSPKISQQEVRTCLLVCLSLRESDIARLTKTSAQRVTNWKAVINKELFKDSSARSLYKNLTNHYEIYTL